MQRLTPGLTAIMYDNQQIAVLEGAVSLPIGARIQIGKSDYIVNNVRVGIRHEDFDLYYDTHLAEVTGASPSPLD
ncbi:hypothetical protein [Microbacterium sp. B19]|uniref:hypothetical protein n=1 Tax=Microbacterium sp. B19 TaxID=96765 RepID=UPI0003B336BD|nr:hypothetical protein [Microbacterium sp. B19]